MKRNTLLFRHLSHLNSLHLLLDLGEMSNAITRAKEAWVLERSGGVFWLASSCVDCKYGEIHICI